MLTRRQRDLVHFIDTYQRLHGGMSPSIDEMTKAIFLGPNSKSSAHRALVDCEYRGAIRRFPHRNRAIEVLRRPKERWFVFDPEMKSLKEAPQ